MSPGKRVLMAPIILEGDGKNTQGKMAAVGKSFLFFLKTKKKEYCN